MKKPLPKNLDQSKSCDCREPNFAPPINKQPFNRGDGTYFRYCLKCRKFKDVEKES